jgi:hypothetical protein
MLSIWVVILLTAAVTLPAAAAVADRTAEDRILSLINGERQARGLGPLAWDDGLALAARRHSATMAAAGSLYHNPDLGAIDGNWVVRGENVGVGPDAATLHDAFMYSHAHRAGILGGYSHAAVGAIRTGEHTIWVTVVFMQAGDAALAPSLLTPAPSTTATAPIPDPQMVPPGRLTVPGVGVLPPPDAGERHEVCLLAVHSAGPTPSLNCID